MPPIRTAKSSSSRTKKERQHGRESDSSTKGSSGRLRTWLHALPTEACASTATTPIANPLLADTAIPQSPAPAAEAHPKEPINAFDLLNWNAPTASSRGETEVHFRADKEWEESWQSRVGPRTKKLSFGCEFVLTDRHVDQLSGLGPGIRPRLTHFEFTLSDVSYTAHNANELTDDAAIRLARLFPSLRVVKLQGADHARLTDATLIAFLSNCPHLAFIEISGLKAAGAIHDSSFDALRRNPAWAPKLKTLRAPPCWESTRKDEDQWMRAMRALSKERQSLLVEIMRVSETKKWGDWELETYAERYRRGRIQSSRPSW